MANEDAGLRKQPSWYFTTAEPHKSRNDLLSFIKDVQRQRNGLSSEDIHGIAVAWGVTASEVYGIATFYSYLGTGPRARNVVRVCKSTPCCLKGCDRVAAEVERVLGIADGGVQADGSFSLSTVNCIGECDRAPAITVNEDVYQGVAAADVRNILSKYGAIQGGEDARA
ncbi:MAG: NAD(P)H-dependent oxidoreductase subunit E [Chloroflexi bacterium]|nr:NAD(P)H-dependent oxidoreductase subunit E [Chloroflexota bacterium]